MLAEMPDREVCCCFTGHRPRRGLPGEETVAPLLREQILQATGDGFTAFISGMAMGFDILAAEEVLRLRDEGAGIHLVAAMPFSGFGSGWPLVWRRRSLSILERADLVVFVSGENLGRGVYQIRNRWMADRSARAIALYLGGAGGTWNTVRYCLSRGVELRFIRPDGIQTAQDGTIQ